MFKLRQKIEGVFGKCGGTKILIYWRYCSTPHGIIKIFWQSKKYLHCKEKGASNRDLFNVLNFWLCVSPSYYHSSKNIKHLNRLDV